MIAEFRNALRRLSGRIWGWGIGTFLYSLLLAYVYEMFAGSEQMTNLLATYPKEMLAFFGEMASSTTPVGYVDTYFYLYMVAILGIFAVGAGAGLIVADEEGGLLDLILAHPVRRREMFWGRCAALAVATLATLFLGWLGWLPLLKKVGLELTPWQLWLPNVPSLLELLLFAALALFLSLLLPSSSMAGSLSGALLWGNWLLRGLAAIYPRLDSVMNWTPLHFFQGGKAVNGLNWTWLLVLLVATAALTGASLWLFHRRDIRVGGERSWSLPAWVSLRRRKS